MRAAHRGAAAALTALLLASPSRARATTAAGDAEVAFRGTTVAFAPSPSAPHPTQLASLAFEAHVVGTMVADRFGPGASFDLELGGAAPLGFAHAVHLRPLGLGLRVGRMGYVMAAAGAGVGGVTGTVPTALELPVGARLALDLSGRVRLLVDARALRAFASSRRGGAPHVPLADETRLGIGARIGRTWDDASHADAGGYFFRLEHSERMGATYVGLVFGWELGGAF